MNKNIKISVIVPCYNCENTIGLTIDSIVNQNYDNLELIVVDGDSNDKTMDIVQSRMNRISKVISEKDKGQYDAINKGISLATGDIVTWLNADDRYFNFTFEIINKIFNLFPDLKWISGKSAFLDENGKLSLISSKNSTKSTLGISKGYYRSGLLGYLQQESMFFKKSLWNEVNGLDLNYNLAADFDLWIKFSKISDLVNVNLPFSGFRIHESSRSKLMLHEYEREVSEILVNHNIHNSLLHKFKTNKRVLNHLLRLFYVSKSEMIFYSFSKKKWLRKKFYDNASGHYLIDLVREFRS